MGMFMKNTLNIDKVTDKMRENGLAQAEVARKLGVSREAVSKWLRNEAYPRPAKLLKLARLLDMGFSDLVVGIPSVNEPVVAFRKKRGCKISADYLEQAKDMGLVLANLVEYLPFDQLSQPAILKNPSLDDAYVQKAAGRIRQAIGVSENAEIPFSKLIGFFGDLHAVLIPVLWGSKDNHENALHIYLPQSMTTWIYLNLDCRLHDFKYWMSHELGHVQTPQLKSDEAEDFAEAFAAALLMPATLAKQEYEHLRRLSGIGAQINHIKAVAERLVVSPFTVYSEINRYAQQQGLPSIDLATRNEIHKATSNFNKRYKLVSEYLFGTSSPSPAEYIAGAREHFDSPFFEVLRKYVTESRKSAGFIQNVLNTSLLDARNIYEELC